MLKAALANRITPNFNAPKSKLQQNGRSNGIHSNDTDEMSTSILRNPAWYRQSDGRTGIAVPRELLNSKHIQQTEIKPRNSSSRVSRVLKI